MADMQRYGDRACSKLCLRTRSLSRTRAFAEWSTCTGSAFEEAANELAQSLPDDECVEELSLMAYMNDLALEEGTMNAWKRKDESVPAEDVRSDERKAERRSEWQDELPEYLRQRVEVRFSWSCFAYLLPNLRFSSFFAFETTRPSSNSKARAMVMEAQEEQHKANAMALLTKKQEKLLPHKWTRKCSRNSQRYAPMRRLGAFPSPIIACVRWTLRRTSKRK